MEKRNKFTGMNSIKFNKHFKTDEDCQNYVADIMWNEVTVAKTVVVRNI